MAETLKSFIDKLQSDGVIAGEQKARKIQAEAEEKARQIISQAQEQAKKIVEDAHHERESIQSKTDIIIVMEVYIWRELTEGVLTKRGLLKLPQII
jgi:cell division septum initiation protein DivIVA